jgi:alpha-mannosidase
MAWDDPPANVESVTMEDFDKTSNHDFPFTIFLHGPVRSTAVREAQFKHFQLREHFHFYPRLDRVDIDVEILNWDGTKERELRVAFPLNLDGVRLSYEVPFGKVEIGKDELDFSLLPPNPDCQFMRGIYGGDQPLPYREAINWIDASADRYQQWGCLAASDCTVHRFHDETSDPVAYPVLQHALLSTRKSHAWNPTYWFTQEGSYRFRMALYPHPGGWRVRYRDGIAFNYPLLAFVGAEGSGISSATLPGTSEFLRLEPTNLILTAMKKAEDDDGIVLRFYEAEGRQVRAKIRLFQPLKHVWKTNLIEEEPEALPVAADGSLTFDVKAWEIVTLKVAL